MRAVLGVYKPNSVSRFAQGLVRQWLFICSRCYHRDIAALPIGARPCIQVRIFAVSTKPSALLSLRSFSIGRTTLIALLALLRIKLRRALAHFHSQASLFSPLGLLLTGVTRYPYSLYAYAYTENRMFGLSSPTLRRGNHSTPALLYVKI